MKFSILTCSYNNRDGVVSSIEAVRDQRTEDLEIEHIVIDGGRCRHYDDLDL